MCILERDSILEQNGQGSLACSPAGYFSKYLEVKFLKILKFVAPNDSNQKKAIANK
jgi:hypothetical protein